MIHDFPLAEVRRRFPGLQRRVGGRPAIFFDGPAGSQVPASVAEAMAHYLLHTNANHGGAFATSRESDAMVTEAQSAVADLLGAPAPEEVVFGANMTTLTFALSRALARTWRRGDNVVVTAADHDANVTPWRLAAQEAGAEVRQVRIRPADCTLDLDHLAELLDDRTVLVSVAAASNLVGTIHPVAQIAALVRRTPALLFVDAVHYAPHGRIDVAAWDCDFLACSAYKFFGPHVGVLWGRRRLLETLPAYKVRPAADTIPDRWMTGTPNFEGIAGTLAAVDYLTDLGRGFSDEPAGRRPALEAALAAITAHERDLSRELLSALAAIEGVRILGIADPARVEERTPTVALTAAGRRPRELETALGEAGIFAWAGNSYALPLTEALGLEPDGVLRVGCLHYHMQEEVRRLADTLAGLLGGASCTGASDSHRRRPPTPIEE